MTEKELKKLNRAQILELFLEQCKRNEALEKELDEVKRQLESKELQISNAGSLAEASLALTNIFEEAQKAADFYLKNVHHISEKPVQTLKKETNFKAAYPEKKSYSKTVFSEKETNPEAIYIEELDLDETDEFLEEQHKVSSEIAAPATTRELKRKDPMSRLGFTSEQSEASVEKPSSIRKPKPVKPLLTRRARKL